MARPAWLRLRPRSAPDLPVAPPLWLGSHSNGEGFHAQTARERLAARLILERADAKARRLGMDRREFLASAMGMATSLSVLNLVDGCGSDETAGGGGYAIPDAATEDAGLACALLDSSKELIFDIQTHHVNPTGSWRKTNPVFASFLSILPQAQDKYGYPELTPERKRKILGLNAARIYRVDPGALRCKIEKSDLADAKRWLDGEVGARRWAFQRPRGPTRRGELRELWRETGGRPG